METDNINTTKITSNTTTEALLVLKVDTWSVYFALFVVWIPGIICNLIALFFIIRDIRKKVFPAIFLLLILICCDLTAVIYSAINHILMLLYRSVLSYPLCVFLSSNYVFFRVASGVMNLFMAVDRYFALCKPFYYKIHVNVRTWKVVCLITCVIMVFYCCFPIFGLGEVILIQMDDYAVCGNLGYRHIQAYRVMGFIFPFIGYVCSVTVVVCNVFVIRALIHLNKRVANVSTSFEANSVELSGEESATPKVTPFEVAFAKLMTCLAAVYLVCGVPYNVSDNLNIIHDIIMRVFSYINELSDLLRKEV
ncbi:hypothetical protein DPMN_012580 [Dreissena polymorpha]|uniref:G-protein coupled receptors family 1 profile domain-containing protein n=1 Tax=Dreissena polymorpha TaxID=45954 RepID=A0A9D4N7A3_DREPO|nr:hypothetical protein DPMN_012580 [Dreissena polymorpha]